MDLLWMAIGLACYLSLVALVRGFEKLQERR